MSDKAEIIRLFTYLKYAYPVGAAFFLFVGLFIQMSDVLFFLGLALIAVPMHLIFSKLFPHKGRSFKDMQKNRKSYGPSGRKGWLGLLIFVFVSLAWYFLLGKSFYSSIYIGIGLSFSFLTLFISGHIRELSERDEIFPL